MTKSNNKKTNLTYSNLLIFVGLVVALLVLCGCSRKRVNREHSNKVSEEFEYLTRRIKVHCPGDRNLSRKEVEQDLDELEWLLENRYSYLKLKGIDYKAALDSIRCSLGDGISRGILALQLMKFIALFGNGHSRVGDPSLKWMCSGYPPFIIGQSKGKLVSFKEDRSDFVDPNFPFLRALDGLPVNTWLEAAGQFVARGSPQFLRYQSIRKLRYIECLRKELGLNNSESIRVELESADCLLTKQIELPISKKSLLYGPWPRTDSRILTGNIGYLRIPVWMSDEKEFLDGLIEFMGQFRDTKGLIIDVRGIGGGSRAPLRVLLPFFISEEEPAQVLNIAAYRLGHRKDILDARWLYPENWQGWSKAEKEAISKLAENFKPQWTLPQNEFSQWHYLVLTHLKQSDYYYYDRPVIILMDTQNYSATDIFLGAFSTRANVTLMGTPSGGGSGRYQSYRLRHSFIKIHLSSMASFQPNGKLYDGNGIQPDVIIEPIPTDFIGKTDSILQTAIQRLQKKDG